MRIDKFLWYTRIVKTRSDGMQMCNSGKIDLDDAIAKPARAVHPNAVLKIRINNFWRSYKVIDLPKSRVGAKLVSSYLIETTPQDTLDQIDLVQNINRENYKLGIKGRPTKKDRRELDDFRD